MLIERDGILVQMDDSVAHFDEHKSKAQPQETRPCYKITDSQIMYLEELSYIHGSCKSTDCSDGYFIIARFEDGTVARIYDHDGFDIVEGPSNR